MGRRKRMPERVEEVLVEDVKDAQAEEMAPEELEDWTGVNEPAAAPGPLSPAPPSHRPGQLKVLVQNVRAGAVLLPRRITVGGKPIYTKPLRLGPGSTTELEAEEWKQWAKNPVIRAMLDRNLLMVVRRPSELLQQQLITRTSSPEVPEHLKSEEQERETGVGGLVKAVARTRGIGTAQVG